MNSSKKLRMHGPQALTITELWSLVLSSTKAAESISQNVRGLGPLPMALLLKLDGVSGVRASRAAACLEIARRLCKEYLQ